MPEVKSFAAAIAATVALLVCTGCGSHVSGATTPAVSARPARSQVSTCEAAVLGLLGESGAALEDGDSGGLDPVQVMSKYGQDSAVYQVFVQLDGAVLTAEETSGNTGLLTPFVSQAAALCGQYSAPAGQAQP